MKSISLEQVKNLYDENIRQFGKQSTAVGWKSQNEHMLRLEKLSHVVKDPEKPFTLNDFGCGYGSQHHYMREAGMNIERYFGYDISGLMLEQAFISLPADGVELLNTSEVKTLADYSIVGGTFNYRGDESEDNWLAYIQEKLFQLYEHSEIGLSFNLLTSFVEWRTDGLFYGDPGFFVNWCKKNLAAHVKLYHDYDLYEWTIIIHRR